MSIAMREKVRALKERIAPTIEPIRVAVLFSEHIGDVSTKENTYYGENMEARNLRYMERVKRGHITMAEYEELAAEPIQNGLYQLPDIDYPLVEV